MKGNGKHHLTPEGLENLKRELNKLKNEDRKRVIESLKEARAQGDLSENADYDAARDEQARLEGRIKELEEIIKNSVIIDSSAAGLNSNLGKLITVEFQNGTKRTFELVGSLESNPLGDKISNESPLGSALLHAKQGEDVIVKTDTGAEFVVKVLEINDKE
mgnify:CR=1 FL=1